MKRAILAASLVILAGVANFAHAQETYPTGTDSVTIYAVGAVVVRSTDSTYTGTGTADALSISGGAPNKMAVMKFPMDDVPSGAAVFKVMFHVHVTNTKAMSAPAAFVVGRLLASYDSTAVTYTTRNGTNQWPSNSILTEAGNTVDTEYNSDTESIRDWVGGIKLATGFTIGSGQDVYMSGDITGMVRAWHSGLWENNGLLLRYAAPLSTSPTQPTIDLSTSANPPYIKVYYLEPGSGGSAGRGRSIGEAP